MAIERIQINASTGINTCAYAASSAMFNLLNTLNIADSSSCKEQEHGEKSIQDVFDPFALLEKCYTF